MALELQPPDGRKRVKVYELRNNDWFDRGTGFCTGQVLDVSPTDSFSPVRNLSRPSFCCDFPHRPINFHAPAPARRSSRDSLLRAHEIIASSHHPFSSVPHPSNYSLAFGFRKLTPCASPDRKYPKYSSNPKMNPIVSSWRRRSSRMAIKNSKVSVPLHPPQPVLPTRNYVLTDLYHAIRDFDSLD